MKWSQYNSVIENGNDEYFLYNSYTNNLIILVSRLKLLIDDNINNIKSIKDIHPEFFEYLCAKKFIVEAGLNETKKAIDNKIKQESDMKSFELTINPTLNCNLRCWYCYEKHIEDSLLDTKLLESIKLFLKSKIEFKGLKVFYLSFFGGEPLMGFEKVVLPIIKYSQELCEINNKRLTVSFTTNAVLLSNSIVDKLLETRILMNFQVPFDGNREFHNQTKKHPNGKGTYDLVVHNVKYGISKGFNIRCNYSGDNIDSFVELIEDFREYYPRHKKQVVFTFQRLWQVEENRKTKEGRELINDVLKKIGAIGKNISDNRSFSTCYADKENSLVINYNGDVFKCTARDFLSEHREGTLLEDGSIAYNQLYYDRMNSKLNNKTCLDCKIYPVCDICTQRRLNYDSKDMCLLRYSEQDKENYIARLIHQISTNTIIEHKKTVE